MMPQDLLQTLFRWDMRQFFFPGPRTANVLDLDLHIDLSLSKTANRKHDATTSDAPATMRRRLEHFSQEVVQDFTAPCDLDRMLHMSARMRRCYRDKLAASTACMLPSFCHSLPTGKERGNFIALDVGGSTFRAALVELGSSTAQEEAVRIKRLSVTDIDERVRGLPAADFFAWMAQQTHTMLLQAADDQMPHTTTPLPLGLAWSFPIEQTSAKRGLIQGMGKGFACQHGTIGQDLGALLQAACDQAGFQVSVEAIINDSSAVLLSQAYRDPATSMGLIVGTGTNATAFLPVSCIGRAKFGVRDQSWFDQADKVITNTELSMFGKGILPETRWDRTLNENHAMPDFQPLEYMTTGRYLGEILRLVIREAVETCGMFGGNMPAALTEQYSLDTRLMAVVEADRSHHLCQSAATLKSALKLSTSPTTYEMAFLSAVCTSISRRASAYLAVAVHALWVLQRESETKPSTTSSTDQVSRTSIACNGSVLLRYPGFKIRCEDYIAEMIACDGADGRVPQEQVVLLPTHEAAIVGAAVAVAIADGT